MGVVGGERQSGAQGGYEPPVFGKEGGDEGRNVAHVAVVYGFARLNGYVVNLVGVRCYGARGLPIGSSAGAGGEEEGRSLGWP